MRRRADPTVPAPREQFRTIVADPGWAYGDKLPGKSRGAAKNYKTMAVDRIARYLESFEMMHELGGEWPDGFVAKDARLFLWRVAPMQEEALHVMRAWGFGAPVSECVWAKVDKDDDAVANRIAKFSVNKGLAAFDAAHVGIEEARRLTFGMGRTFRMSHETCLVGRRGRPERLSGSERSVFFAPLGEHSQKPEEFFELVERLSPGPYLELFAAGHRRPGWTCLGDDHRSPP
jgi:N6-adenosine-specific RNA methylase IME4